MIIEGELAKGREAASLELIVTELDKTGISYEEIDEANKKSKSLKISY